MHPGSGCYDGTLANGLIYRYPELANLPRSGIVHRLDKDTSGVLLIAKNEQFRNYFIDQMQHRNVTKEYTAIVVGSTLGSFSIEEPICLKLVRCFCCYSASTKTSFGFCSCSELLQLKFGKKNVAGKCKLLSPQDSYRGD